MKLRHLYVLIISLLGTVMIQANNLRMSVVLVEPEYKSMRTFLDEYSLALSHYRYYGESRTMLALRSGVSGSGVVLQQGDSLLVLTNRHVVGFAPTVRVKQIEGDKKQVWRHCPVLAVSSLTDLALILLPDSAMLSPMQLSEQVLKDADEIYAAGYPGLAGSPSWQVTKGIVSNSELYHEDLLGKHQAAIQHTASIDPGSSGGPLLQKTDDETYRVVGLNTWKAGNREGVGIAIPTKSIRQFLQGDAGEETMTDEERTIEWNQLLREDVILAAKSLSITYLLTRPAEDWELVLETMGEGNRDFIDESEHNSVLDAIRYVWAIEMMRYAMAGGEDAQFDLVWETIQGKQMIVDVIYPELNRKQLMQATSRLRK